ncbi:CDGSH iron-sulfur domain-containing protein [Rhodococcus sp. NPDC003348]
MIDRADPPAWDSPAAQLVRRVPGGPALVRGPVRLTRPDGQVIVCERFVVAVCRCRRSTIFPLCDTSHRSLRRRSVGDSGVGDSGFGSAADGEQ